MCVATTLLCCCLDIVAFLPRFFLGAGWKGDQSYLFDERINATNEFETQAYTSLMQVGDNAAYVVYNK